MANVLQSCSSRPVPVGLYLSPLHPRLMDLPLLFVRPVQHAVAQQGSLLRTGDVKGWQPWVNRGVSCDLLTWFFASHWLFWLFTLHPLSSCICWGHHHRIVSVTTSLFASRTACTTCTGAVTTACSSRFTAAAAGCRLPYVAYSRRSLLHHQWFSLLLWSRLPAQYRRCLRYLRPRRFWAWGLVVHASSGSW